MHAELYLTLLLLSFVTVIDVVFLVAHPFFEWVQMLQYYFEVIGLGD